MLFVAFPFLHKVLLPFHTCLKMLSWRQFFTKDPEGSSHYNCKQHWQLLLEYLLLDIAE